MKNYRRSLRNITLFCLLFMFGLTASGADKREFRGAWIHIVGNNVIKTLTTEQTQNMFLEALDSIKNAGCNAVIFQVRPTADAFYNSEIEPWSRYLTGVQGKVPNPYWDPLEFMVKESHKRGMEIHAWCNPYRVTMAETDTLCSNHIYFSNPDIFVKYGKQLYFNPTKAESRAHTTKVIADIVRRYDIDAIHFDDYFYPYPINGEVFNDGRKFNNENELGDWRRANVELLIKELNDTIKSIKPWVRFGISPFGIHRNKKDTPDGSGSQTNGLSNYDQLFADVPGWAKKGYIDYYVPQLYWVIGHPKADYATLAKWWNKQHTKGHLYIGQSIGAMKNQIKRKMNLNSSLPSIEGNVWWPGWSLVSNKEKMTDSLAVIYQKYPALIPAYKDIDNISPKELFDIKKNGRLIEWQQDEDDAADSMQKGLFYAVYCFPKGAKIDIGNNKFLLELTDKNSYNVIEENPKHAAGCCYVVTVIDRCWNESKPSKTFWY